MGTDTMRIAVYERFGPPEVLQLREAAIPVPRPRQVRIRVFATTVTQAETNMRKGLPRWGRLLIGIFGPRKKFRTLGTELAGVVDAVGREVTRFRPGDRVFGFAGFHIGANADYFCMDEEASLCLIPEGVSFADGAAAVDGPTTAIYFLDKARLQAGQRILIIGASGSVGSFAVQLAHRAGAFVTGVCSGKNSAFVRRLGADDVIDYTRESLEEHGGKGYDVVLDAVGKSSFAACRPVMAPRSVYVDPTFAPQSLWRAAVQGPWTKQRVQLGMSVEKRAALSEVARMLAERQLTVHIERTYPLEQLVEAHRHVDSGHKVGNVAVVMQPEPARANPTPNG